MTKDQVKVRTDSVDRSGSCDGSTDGCEHPVFDANVSVCRLEDIGRFTADVTINCAVCGVSMRFIGLPAGLDLNGASVSVCGTEGRFAIAPKGEVVSELEGTPVGFTVRKHEGVDEKSESENSAVLECTARTQAEQLATSPLRESIDPMSKKPTAEADACQEIIDTLYERHAGGWWERRKRDSR